STAVCRTSIAGCRTSSTHSGPRISSSSRPTTAATRRRRRRTTRASMPYCSRTSKARTPPVASTKASSQTSAPPSTAGSAARLRTAAFRVSPSSSADSRVIHAAELIQRKRDGGELGRDELSELVLAYAHGAVPDYQMSAFCMAVYFRGLNGDETFALTDAMIKSGETIDLRGAVGRKVVDKRSTGGVGDKTSLAVGPVVAACGVPFGKMSGRGLGHTGGTLDKLESIPGFRVELDIDAFVEQVRKVGLAIVGQTGDLVPADKKLYALRAVTATGDIVPLIASSIMSKKLAAGADAIVLDVKVGDGAFMKTLDDARILAEQM